MKKEDSLQLKKIKEQIMRLSYKDKVLLQWYLYDTFWKSLEQQRIAEQVIEQDKDTPSKLSDD